MFRPAGIRHIRSFIPKHRVEKVIRALHAAGICEIKETEADIESEIEFPEITEIDEMLLQVNNANSALAEYKDIIAPENIVKSLFFPEKPETFSAELLSTGNVLEHAKKTLAAAEPAIEKLSSELNAIEEKTSENNFKISNLEMLPNEDTSLFRATKSTAMLTGAIAATSLEKIRAELSTLGVYGVSKIDEQKSLITIACEPEKEAMVEKLLHEQGFSQIDLPEKDGKPHELVRKLKDENNGLMKDRKKVEAKFKALWKTHHGEIGSISESLEICKERVIAVRKMKNGESFSILEAWVPEKDISKFRETMKTASGEYYAESEDRDDAPTVFNNLPIVNSFEIITELYSPPKYKEFDPTILIALSFSLFFGFMLTDAAYGAITIIIALLIYKGIGKVQPGMRKFSVMLMVLGSSTLVLGIIFGSYFGNIIHMLLGLETGGKLPLQMFDTIMDVIIVIALAIVIGAGHLFIGLLVGYRENMRKKKVMAALSEQGVWILFVIGIVLVLIGQGIVATIGMGLIGISVLLQLVTKFLESGPVVSIIAVFNFSGFIGDVFSYARLTALAVGTAGIALAVNFMALMSIKLIPIVGIPIGIIIFIGGHSFNMAMNGLGSFIHTLRLHFLEFFTKFYDGGGRVYKPFYAYRKIKPTEVK